MQCDSCGAVIVTGSECPRCAQGDGLQRSADPLLDRLGFLAHQYRILRLLGRGAMGAVYLAHESALDRHVAIKVLPLDATHDSQSRERFRREARIAARLHHPGLVPLYSFGEHEDLLYFVMAYVDGETLGQRMRRDRRFDSEEVRRVLAELADAIGHAHQHGVVHRDVKPDNVLVEGSSGRVMLADFGVASASEAGAGATLTSAGTTLGTPHYMSPEQVEAKGTIDGRSDLYALGVIGYQMLSGRLPFDAASAREVMLQHLGQAPAPLSAIVPDAPPELTEVIMRCLEKDPAQRWSTAEALRVALEEPDDPLALSRSEEMLDGYLFTALAFLAGVVWATALVYNGQIIFLAFLPIALLGALAIAAILAKRARGHGMSWNSIRRRLCYPDRRWPCWWPARWRRPRDQWPLLPRVVRLSRTCFGLALIWVFLLTPLLITDINQRWATDQQKKMMGGLMAGGLMLFLAVPLILTARWARREGLHAEDRDRILLAPTLPNAFWQLPRIKAVLQPPPGSTSRLDGEPRSAAQLAEDVVRLVRGIDPPLRIVVAQAEGLAREAAGEIDALDRRIEALLRDLDPAEAGDIDARLSALGVAQAEENELRREKRTLLLHQRALLRQMASRQQDMQARRERLRDLLRTIWLQLARLEVMQRSDGGAASEISGRIASLCAEIEAQVTARNVTAQDSESPTVPDPQQTLRVPGGE